MPPAVPHEARDPVAERDPEAAKAVRELPGPAAGVGIGLAVRPPGGEGDHFDVGCERGAAVEQPRHQERGSLHRHGVVGPSGIPRCRQCIEVRPPCKPGIPRSGGRPVGRECGERGAPGGVPLPPLHSSPNDVAREVRWRGRASGRKPSERDAMMAYSRSGGLRHDPKAKPRRCARSVRRAIIRPAGRALERVPDFAPPTGPISRHRPRGPVRPPSKKETLRMPHAIRIHETGGPEVMRYEQVAVGAPGPGEARIRQAAVGLNYIDVYFRAGLYPSPALPFSPGMEGAGEDRGPRRGGRTISRSATGWPTRASLGAYRGERIIAGGPAGAGPRFGGRRGRRVHDAPRHDRPVPPEEQLPGEVRRHHPRPRRGGRGRDSSPASGRSISAPPSSAPSAAARRPSSRGPTDATIPSSTPARTSWKASARG